MTMSENEKFHNLVHVPCKKEFIKSGAPTFIDLFAGAGGLSLGFLKAGCRSVFAVENDTACVESYRTNFPDASVFNGNIESIESFAELEVLKDPAIDIVVGGPPCQGFSPLGKNDCRKRPQRAA